MGAGGIAVRVLLVALGAATGALIGLLAIGAAVGGFDALVGADWNLDGDAFVALWLLALLAGAAGGGWLVLRWTRSRLPARAAIARQARALLAALGAMVVAFVVMAIISILMVGLIYFFATGELTPKTGLHVSNNVALTVSFTAAAAGFGAGYWFGLRRGWRTVLWLWIAAVVAIAAAYGTTRL